MTSIYDQLPVYEKHLNMERTARMEAMLPLLCSWYEAHHRILPWREDVSPYHTWVSEIMLQQTRVEAVKPYYARFLSALPDVRALAEAEEELLLKLWEGLGYYSRVRNMQAAAIECAERYDGQLPSTYAELLKLKGIGTYTAGAIASIAYGEPVPAVDGNVLRVMARLTADEEDIGTPQKKKQLEEELTPLMNLAAPGTINQALMELGATVCVPNGAPKCEECPVKELCLARIRQITDHIPYKAPKKPRRLEERSILLIHCGEKYLIRKRPKKGLLAGMYEFPGIERWFGSDEKEDFLQALVEMGIEAEQVADIAEAGSAKHIFSHVEWEMQGFLVEMRERAELADGVWATKQEMDEVYSLPSAFRAYKEYIERKK